MNAFVVSGLIKRRAELAGEIERTHEALRKMVHRSIFSTMPASDRMPNLAVRGCLIVALIACRFRKLDSSIAVV
jgi:hypothetical protein